LYYNTGKLGNIQVNCSLLAVSNGTTVDARWLSARVRARLGACDAGGGATADGRGWSRNSNGLRSASDAGGGATVDGWGWSRHSNGLCSASSRLSRESLRTWRTERSCRSWWSLGAVHTGFAVLALKQNCNDYTVG